jgi:hypothetical protein
MNPEIVYSLLNRALSEELGLVVECNNPRQLSEWLLNASRDLEKYAPLMITIPSTPDTVIIVKKTVELDEDV